MNNKFALLVPCFNAERHVTRFLGNISKLSQAFDEVLFYDDASTDNTCEVLQQKNFKVVRGAQNMGPGFARNKLAESTSCEWFHFHDIDDELNVDYLIKTAAVVGANQSIDVVLCDVDWCDAQSKKLQIAWRYSNSEIGKNPVAYTISHPIGGINGLYRKAKFIESGGFDTRIRIWEDADLHVRLAVTGAKFHVIEEVLSFSYRYPESVSADQKSGWLVRLDLLICYQKKLKDRAVQDKIGKQAQIAATNLLLLGQSNAAKKAFRLSESCGVKVPNNNSKVWQLLKLALPRSLRIRLRLFQLKKAFKK